MIRVAAKLPQDTPSRKKKSGGLALKIPSIYTILAIANGVPNWHVDRRHEEPR